MKEIFSSLIVAIVLRIELILCIVVKFRVELNPLLPIGNALFDKLIVCPRKQVDSKGYFSESLVVITPRFDYTLEGFPYCILAYPIRNSEIRAERILQFVAACILVEIITPLLDTSSVGEWILERIVNCLCYNYIYYFKLLFNYTAKIRIKTDTTKYFVLKNVKWIDLF